jgi:hypothetical protein
MLLFQITAILLFMIILGEIGPKLRESCLGSLQSSRKAKGEADVFEFEFNFFFF